MAVPSSTDRWRSAMLYAWVSFGSVLGGLARYFVSLVLDTGPGVQGRLVDLYMWSCNEALAFGRKDVRLTVLRLGWNPVATTPSLLDRLLNRSERPARSPLPARPFPQIPTDN